MTIDRAKVEHGARLAPEATPGPWRVAWETEHGQYGSTLSQYPTGITRTDGGFIAEFADDYGTDQAADAAFIAHWNPEFAAEVVQELQRLWRMEEALGTAKLRHGVLSMAIDDGDDYGEHVGLQRHRRAVYEGQAEILALWEVALANPAAEEKA